MGFSASCLCMYIYTAKPTGWQMIDQKKEISRQTKLFNLYGQYIDQMR